MEKDEIKINTIGQLLDYVETEEKANELIGYITNLQEENERLKERFDALLEAHKIADELETEYQERNEKAIQYINSNIKNREGLTVEEYKVKWRMMLDYYESQEIMEELLNILQGEDKDE